MGCCTIFSIEHEAENFIITSKPEDSGKVSFFDLSIVSDSEKLEDVDLQDFRENLACGRFVQTEELNFSQTSRLRSTSCNSYRYNSNIETAFLMSAPLKTDRGVSRSCNLKNNETLMDYAKNFE